MSNHANTDLTSSNFVFSFADDSVFLRLPSFCHARLVSCRVSVYLYLFRDDYHLYAELDTQQGRHLFLIQCLQPNDPYLAFSKTSLLTVFFFQGRTVVLLSPITLVSPCITTFLNNGIRLFDLNVSAVPIIVAVHQRNSIPHQ